KTSAQRLLKKRFEDATKLINEYWLQKTPENIALSEESLKAWILTSEPEEIAVELGIINESQKKTLRKKCEALQYAKKLIDTPIDRYSGIDALRALQPQPISRQDQLRRLFGN